MELQGKDRDILEDITAKPVTYATIIKGSLALGRIVSKFSEEGENVGVLMPNVNATVYLLLGMFADASRSGNAEFHIRDRRDAERVPHLSSEDHHYFTRLRGEGKVGRSSAATRVGEGSLPRRSEGAVRNC